jgi:hypothetical protein
MYISRHFLVSTERISTLGQSPSEFLQPVSVSVHVISNLFHLIKSYYYLYGQYDLSRILVKLSTTVSTLCFPKSISKVNGGSKIISIGVYATMKKHCLIGY